MSTLVFNDKHEVGHQIQNICTSTQSKLSEFEISKKVCTSIGWVKFHNLPQDPKIHRLHSRLLFGVKYYIWVRFSFENYYKIGKSDSLKLQGCTFEGKNTESQNKWPWSKDVETNFFNNFTKGKQCRIQIFNNV